MTAKGNTNQDSHCRGWRTVSIIARNASRSGSARKQRGRGSLSFPCHLTLFAALTAAPALAGANDGSRRDT